MIFAGGCTYWLLVSLVLNYWRAALTTGRVIWLNRASSAMMVVAAAEAAVGLAIIIAVYRTRETLNVDRVNLLKL